MTATDRELLKQFQSPQVNDWCAGCGDFGILKGLQKALAQLQRDPDQVAVFGGIGCSGKTPYYMGSSGIHTLHGRVISFAAGAKLANPELTVIAVGGDGDGLSIGAGHFVNAARRNLDITYLLFNNGVYGLTKGQAAPTLRQGEQTRSMPVPADQYRLPPVSLAAAAGYSWIGRGYAYNQQQLTELIASAIAHPGTALLEILQPCPTYNDLQTHEWYSGVDAESGLPRLYDLAGVDHNPLLSAGADEAQRSERTTEVFRLGQQWGERIPTGLFLCDLSRPPYRGTSTAAHSAISDAEGHSQVDITPLLDQLRVR